MDNSNVSPVTENDMRAFFDRIATSFVSLSEQAKQLVELQSQFTGLDIQVRNLVEDNHRQRQQIETLVAERDKARDDAAEALRLAQAEEQSHGDTKRKLHETEQTLVWVRHDLEAARQDMANLSNENNGVKTEAAKLRNELARTHDDLSYSESNAKRAWATVEDRNSVIATLNTKIAKFKAIFEDTAEPDPVLEPHVQF